MQVVVNLDSGAVAHPGVLAGGLEVQSLMKVRVKQASKQASKQTNKQNIKQQQQQANIP